MKEGFFHKLHAPANKAARLCLQAYDGFKISGRAISWGVGSVKVKAFKWGLSVLPILVLGYGLSACASAGQDVAHIAQPVSATGTPALKAEPVTGTNTPSAQAPVANSSETHITAAPKTGSGENCKPVYTQIYQPPLKLGGSGRILNIKTGVNCG